jgi:hypothetical protein
MPLIIGEINANIEVERRTEAAPSPPAVGRDEEKRRAMALAAERFERERRIDQRDPDLLGGR